ncbi:Protein N-acetyltransferase, RimJ/RimL family [Marinobacter sp. LV10R510-11A]|uniref:GNAT family N-acetyltransferase n=1 Tax=Marinobacter sp. LV10R510-11A TaxID=1415568 RepID=UPI000BB8F6A4|nr:GNAT family N-acetyltransferase [Marinobacter sp. LV10R510-11A]SOB77448.1 Protein N-acetyltransferase, RimJ/RimL family [Marinobacter sp. LV10R510-11A]
MADNINFAVRTLELSDIPNIVSYWLESSPTDLARMGADASKFPTAEQLEISLRSGIGQANHDAQTSYLIWLINNIPIGFSSLKNIHFCQTGEMHLHMWDASYKGRGYGGILFCLSALKFYEKFKLNSITCEPRSSNPLPNKLFSKIGFPLTATRVGASSELSLICELNQYTITKNIAEEYLANLGLNLDT